jgi:peptidoglycan/LPS O-acetylase OafA/YrhL
LGLALGIAEWMLSGSHRITGGDASSSWVVVFSALASNVLFLPGPWFSAMSPHANFPVNFPSWSLFLELLINLVYVALVRFLSMRVLIGIVAVFGCAVSAAILMNGQSDLGYAYETFLGGFLRCGFSFFMGILLFRLRGHMRIFTASRLWLVGVLLACLAFAAPSPFRPFVDLIVIIAISPANVWLAASPQKNEKPEPALFRLLGETSYGMYAIHVPLIGLLTTALWQLSSPLNHYIALGVGVAFIAFTILVTAFLDRSYDRPLRKMLLARLFWTANKRQSVA